ncbi:MAG: putative Bug-like extra-cytoplasmic solute receptor, TTT-family [Betaproteobacteria bacterium]|nr:putative Bug-like extra-cytoplasmic solute receptor, TTT-family [Betaproteobacteria bacterium]
MKHKLTAVAALLCAAAFLHAAPAAAQAYPAKGPVHLVVGFAPAGAADIVARSMSDAFSKALGQSVIIENRPGAGSSVAADYVAHAVPDGYTILLASPSSISVNPAIMKLNYSARDLVPISKTSSGFLIAAVNTSLGINSLKDLIAAAKKSPGKLNYATSGIGAAPHLSAVLFAQLAGLDIVHVPFKGGSPAVQSVVAGDTQFTFATAPSVLPLIRSGRLKALAITSKNRSPLTPDIPGMAEAGLPDYDMSFWYGLFAPVGTPAAALKKVFEANAAALQDPAVKAAFAREGTETAPSKSPEDFVAYLAEDNKFWTRLIKDSGVKPE